METITLKRDGTKDLPFVGECIGRASSFHGQPRWSEVAIYRTREGSFVVAGTGRTIIAGESDRFWAKVADTGEAVYEILIRVDDDKIEYLTRTAKSAMEAAAQHDERIRAAILAERVA